MEPLADTGTRRLSRNESLALLVLVAFFALVFAAIGHHECTTYWADVPRPEAGTPRANYCGVTDAAFPLLQVAIPLLTVSGALALGKGRSRIAGTAAIAVLIALFAHMILCSVLNARSPYHSADHVAPVAILRL